MAVSLFVCLYCMAIQHALCISPEVISCHSSAFLREPELVLLDMQSVPAGQEGWLAFDVTSASNRWLLHPRSNLGIRLYVETEEGEPHRVNTMVRVRKCSADGEVITHNMDFLIIMPLTRGKITQNTTPVPAQ